jgi:hypothetical protein
MPTSALYDSTSQHLTASLPDALASQIETLALIVVGIVHSVSAQIGKIARALPLKTYTDPIACQTTPMTY